MHLLLARLLPWAKLIQPLLILTLLATVAVLHSQLGHKKDQLRNETDQRGELAKLVGAQGNWASIRTHSRNLITSNANLNAALAKISAETLASKKRADALDAQLRREQAENAKKYEAAQRTIQDLLARKPTGNPEIDRRALEEDSKAPWKAWRGAAAGQSAKVDWDLFDPEFNNTKGLTIRLNTYGSLADMRDAYLSITKVNPKKIDGYILYGFADFTEPGLCDVHVLDPKVLWTESARSILGHEVAHCFYGNWHSNTKGAL